MIMVISLFYLIDEELKYNLNMDIEILKGI
jgi:hypothetical protein